MVGLFPCNFVESVEDKSTPPPENPRVSKHTRSRQPTPDLSSTVRGGHQTMSSSSPKPDGPWDGMRYAGDAETIKSMARSSFIRDEPARPVSRASYMSRDDILRDITAELSRGSSAVSRFSSVDSNTLVDNERVDKIDRNDSYGRYEPNDYSNDYDSDSSESYAPSFIPSRGNSLLKAKENNHPNQDAYNSYDSYDHSYRPIESTYRESSYQNYDDASDDSIESTTPPIPPRHSVPVSRMNSVNSTPPSSSPQNKPLNLDRTPSPLRNAMDDVLESLDHMADLSRSTTLMSSFDDDDESVSATITKSQRSRIANSHSSPSANYTNLAQRFSQASLNQNRHSNYQEEEEGYIPFDPKSYEHIATANSHSQPEWPIARADTYGSTTSSINTNSLSIISHSTAPTTVSNLSSSNGSMDNPNSKPMRTNTNSTTSDSRSSSSARRMSDFIDDVPVKLPDARTTVKDNKSVKSLKLRKSAGFIKKLFSSGDGETADLDGVIDSLALKRTKSHSSRKSTTSTSSHFRNSLRKVSARSLFGNRHSTSQHQTTNWMEAKRDIHRSNTITKHEADQRKLQLELHGFAIKEPIKALSLIAGNETLSGPSKGEGKRNIAMQDFSTVDETIAALTSWPKLMTPAVFASSRIGRQFDYDIDRLRAVFDLCASKFTWEQALPQDDDDEDTIGSGSFSRLMQTKRATSQELAYCVKSMCEALEIPCEVVRGHLKIPGQGFVGVPKLNHYWNAVVIDSEWRFIDVSLANPSFAYRDYYYRMERELKRSMSSSTSPSLRVNHFYFMTRPLDLIYTHVPCYIEDQHIIPTLSPDDALALPIAGPELFKYDVKLVDFHTGLTKMTNLEIVEFVLSVQHGVELLAEVVVGNMMNPDDCIKIPGLAQAYWDNNRRYFRVKGYLPEPYSQGVVNIYVGERGSLQSISKNTLGLAYSIGITHSGENAPLELLTRHPTPHCKRQDLYVKQPQCKKLLEGNTYMFSVIQHPSAGITSGSGFARVKIGIQSPSGRITKMHISEGNHVSGTWEASVKCWEVGTWRGLVLADSGNAWSVFAEWYCI